MNLTLFFRLIVTTMFQSMIVSMYKDVINRPFTYDTVFFFCPKVYAKDGFNVSLQIHNGNYCSSENGYRKLGHTWERVEFGFPSMNEPLMFPYAEIYDGEPDDDFDITRSVGSIPISILEDVFTKHGGIDWEKTISIDNYLMLIKP